MPNRMSWLWKSDRITGLFLIAVGLLLLTGAVPGADRLGAASTSAALGIFALCLGIGTLLPNRPRLRFGLIVAGWLLLVASLVASIFAR